MIIGGKGDITRGSGERAPYLDVHPEALQTSDLHGSLIRNRVIVCYASSEGALVIARSPENELARASAMHGPCLARVSLIHPRPKKPLRKSRWAGISRKNRLLLLPIIFLVVCYGCRECFFSHFFASRDRFMWTLSTKDADLRAGFAGIAVAENGNRGYS